MAMRGITAITIIPLPTFKRKKKQEQIKKGYGVIPIPHILMSSGKKRKNAETWCKIKELMSRLHYGKMALSSWNFAFAVLYCGVFILTNRKGEKTELKTIWTENYIQHKKATSTKLPHLVNKAFNQWKVVLCRVAFSIHGAFLLCISIGALW